MKIQIKWQELNKLLDNKLLPLEKLQENKLETKLLENQLQLTVELKNLIDIDQELLPSEKSEDIKRVLNS